MENDNSAEVTNKDTSILTKISQLDRSDTSLGNVKKAKSLLKFTGHGSIKYCVIYLKEKREHRTAWFNNKDRARLAREIITRKGFQSVVYVD